MAECDQGYVGRAAVRVLFIRERFAGGDKNFGLSDSSSMVECLVSTDMGQAVVFNYDDCGVDQDEAALRVFREIRPDVVCTSPLLNYPRNISKPIYNEMRASGAKVVGIWMEGVAPDVVREADEYAPHFDLNVFCDTRSQFLPHTKYPEKCLGLYDPRNREKFKPARKNIGVIFNGSLLNRPVRTLGIKSLLDAGIPVTKIGGRLELFMGEEQMLDLMGRAAICINFSDAGPYRHMKGRVAEALLSGCLLLELRNVETDGLLEPFKEFVPFDSPQELVSQVSYYLTDGQAELVRIAAAGRVKALEECDGRSFWRQLFERVGASPQ